MGAERVRTALVMIASVALVFGPTSAQAWGPLAHQIAYRAAIERLPPSPFRDWLLRNANTGARQSMTPDIDWKPFLADDVSPSHREQMTRMGPGERPTHFFDADLLLPRRGPMRTALQSTANYDEALPILRQILKNNPATAALADAPWELGSVPWRTAQVWQLLVDALKKRDFPRAQLYAAVLTHYAAEHTNPLHADSRYDGIPALTGGPGLHLMYEMYGFETELERRGAVRPPESRGVWEVPATVLAPFMRGGRRQAIKEPQAVVKNALDFVIAGQPAVHSLSKAYGETILTDTKGTVDAAAFYARPLTHQGFSGTVGQHAEKHVTEAAAFASALLEGAYLAASQDRTIDIAFPKATISFNRQFVVENHPTPPNIRPALTMHPISSQPGRPGACLIELVGLLAR